MHKLTFYPVGNANCFLIELDKGQLILFDYANPGNPDDKDELRIDTESELKELLKIKNRDNIDVVAFTHIDRDHIGGASKLFHLEHAKEYQGKDRIKIDTLWVPAGAITEKGVTKEARIIRAEARHRLKEGKNIRVFSRPELLEGWLNEQDPPIKLKDRQNLITDAGQPIPGFTTNNEGVKFFLHSPFAKRQDGKLNDRNGNCIVVQATFLYGETETKVILTGDIHQEPLDDVVLTTIKHENEHRLEWDIYNVSHHCSYKSLQEKKENKGKEKTEPTKEIKWLLEEKGNNKGIIVSSSDKIPGEDTDQPPHRQAANYYKECAKKINGQFIVTMEHPKASAPKPLVITIDGSGATVKKQINDGVPAIATKPIPRAG